MTSPANARTLPGGVRVYTWPAGAPDPRTSGVLAEDVDVLSVTSIRKLCGESMNLVSWQIANVCNVAMGTRRVTFVGPRGGVREKYVPDGEWPGQFVKLLMETGGDTAKLAEVRKWLRQTADEPRDTAAVRGSVVHKCIEMNVRLDQLTDEYIAGAFDRQWKEERTKKARPLLDDDFNFVRNCMRQFWDMRAHVPFVILAAEPQCWNLTHGYAGSFDVLVWFLGAHDADGTFHPLPGQDVRHWQREASAGRVTLATIAKVGGEIVLGDWKTSKDTHTDHAVQVTAYLATEFVGTDGVVDARVTELLRAAMNGALIHIRPNAWSVEFIDFRPDALRAFLGSCAFARFLAMNPTLEKIVTSKVEGCTPDTEGSTSDEEAA